MRPAVIIGDGASGVLAAAALARQDAGPVVLVGSSDRPGLGLAYRTTASYHLLNSRACSMSAHADRPDDFVRWCGRAGAPVEGAAFVSRRRYGAYLTETLDHLVDTGAVARQPGRAVAVDPAGPAGPTVRFADGAALPARSVVLATGHDAPVTPPVPGLAGLDPARYVPDPWQDEGIARAAAGRDVLLIGTGLTAVDVALTLHRRRPDLAVTAMSRHGLLPAAHVAEPAAPQAPIVADGVGDLLRQVRARIAAGADWRAVVDGLRCSADRLWSDLPLADRRRFLTHVDRYWQVHRHRMAPPVARAIAAMRDADALRIDAGRLVAVTPHGAGVEVRVRSGDTERILHCGVIVNCTGPGRWAAGRDPLAVSLRSAGLARLDSLGCGLACDPLGRPLDTGGRPVDWLWALGPLRLGSSWETTAVPEIRAQADALATAMTGRVRRRPVA